MTPFRLALATLLAPAFVNAQEPELRAPPPVHPPAVGRASTSYGPGLNKSPNVQLVSHIPLGGFLHVAEIEIEEEMARPYVYIAKRFHPTGLDIISIKDEKKPKVVYSWRIENSELTQGSGALEVKYFKLRGKYYLVLSTQFAQGGPHVETGAVIFDVTGLPDPNKVKEVGRIKEPSIPGGFHEIYTYKHSDGRVLLFTTTRGPKAHIYDMEKFLAGDAKQGLIGEIPIPQNPTTQERLRGYHDFYVGFDPAAQKDKFYGAGAGGYYVYDVTAPESPQLMFSLTGVAGVTYGHTFTPTPDGAFAVTETEYQYAPLRLFDLRDGQSGKVKNINRPIGAWTANWRNLSHNHEVRWPYVFVSAYEDGLHIFNMLDPTEPVTVGFYDTYEGPHMARGSNNVNMGAWGVDVRNSDGLIVVSDMMTGFWAFRMDGFDGWNGKDWGMPNISSVQDWDNGPDGAQKSRRVTSSQP